MKPAICVLMAGFILCFAPILPAEGSSVYILVYHTFLGSGTSSLDFSRSELQDQLDAFSRLGYRWVSLEDAVAGSLQGRNNLVMTIDDGHRSVPLAWETVIKPAGIIPTLFITTDPVVNSRYNMNPGQVRMMYDSGCGIGSHGHLHHYLSSRAFAEQPTVSRAEIQVPGPLLESWTGARPVFFAYPYGVAGAAARAMVAAEAYSHGFLADHQLVAVDFSDPEMDPYAVPRTIVYRWNLEILYRALARATLEQTALP